MSSDVKKSGSNEGSLGKGSDGSLNEKSDSDIKNNTRNSKPKGIQEKYVPKAFRGQSPNRNKKDSNRFIPIKRDCKELRHCSAICQLFVLVSSALIILIITLSGCTEVEDEDSESQMTTDLSPTTNATNNATNSSLFSIKDWSKEVVHGNWLKCVTNIYFVAILSVSIVVQFITLVSYVYHWVEAYPKIPWLVMECIFYTVWTIQYLIMSAWISTTGGWMISVSVIGFNFGDS